MAKIIVNGDNAVLGRIGSYVAKELLKGNSIELINCEKIVVSGDKKNFVKKIRAKRDMGRGSSLKGPKYSRQEDMIVKRIIRGMLPWDRMKGREALRRLRCEIGSNGLNEDEIKKTKKLSHQMPKKYSTIKEIVGLLK